MQEQTLTIILALCGIGLALAVQIYTMMRSLRTDITKHIESFREDATKRSDSIAGKVAQVDSRLIEVEKHLFALRTLLHYDTDFDGRKEK